MAQPTIIELSSYRAHIGDELIISGLDFGSTQSTSTLTIGGVMATVISWADTSITVSIPEVIISDNDYVDIVIDVGGLTYTISNLWMLLGGILRFVNPDNWSEVLLDLDNGGDDSGQEIWQEQGTQIPPPSTEPIFTEPDTTDGESLVHSRLTNKEIALQLLLTGGSKDNLDITVQNLLLEIYKDTGCLEYRPERSSKSIYYTYYRATEAPDFADYFTHKERGENYAYDVLIKLPCKPWAETNEEEIVVSKNLFPNGSFEQGLVGWESVISGSGTPTVTVDTTRYKLGETQSCQLLTNHSAGIAGIKNQDFIPVDSTKTHNIQIFGWKQGECTIHITATLYCYKDDGGATDTPTVPILVNKTPSGAVWEDMVIINGVPIIYPEGSHASPVWPTGTKKIKLLIQHTGDIGTVSIDGVLLTESEFISDNTLEASLGIVVPEGEVKGQISAPMDIYISGANNTGKWNSQNTGVLNDLYGIGYVSSSLAVAVGSGGKILYNNGSTWVSKTSGISASLYSINWLDSSHFWTVGENGVIMFSSDGNTWSTQAFPSLIELLSSGDMEAWVGANMTYWDFIGFFDGTFVCSPDKKSGSWCARMQFPSSLGEMIIDGGWDQHTDTPPLWGNTGPTFSWWDRGYPFNWLSYADTEHNYDGTYCLEVFADEIDTSVSYTSHFAFPISTNGDYAFSFRSFQDVSNKPVQLKLTIQFYNSLGSLIGTHILFNARPAYSSSHTYTLYSGSLDSDHVPEGAIYGKLEFKFTCVVDVFGSIWLDTVSMTMTSVSAARGTLMTKQSNLVAIDARKSHLISFWAKGSSATPSYTAAVDFWDSTKTHYLGSHTICPHTYATTSYVNQVHTLVASDCPAGTAYIAVWLSAEDSTTWNGRWVEFDDVSITVLNPNLKSVCAIASNNVLAVGEWGEIVKFDGSNWTRKTSGVITHLNAITAVDSSHIIAVGDDGVILTSANGSNWTTRTSGTTWHIYGVTALSSGKVWAVGLWGTLLYSADNGVTWVQQTNPTNQTLVSVYAYDATHVWACGQNGTLISFDGTNWIIEGSGSSVNLNSISAYDATHVLMVGLGGGAIAGISSVTPLSLTDLIIGQRKGYHPDFNPVLDATATTINAVGTYRRRSRYRAMSAGEEEEFLFNVYKHKGVYLISVGAGINNAVNFDQIVPTLRLKDNTGVAITPTVTLTSPAYIDLSIASGYTSVGYFREIAMLASKFDEINIPSSFVSSIAKQANINQSIIIKAPSGMAGGDRLNVDCISLIPTDESYLILNNWRTGASGAQQAFMIISSTDGLILSSITNSIESAMVYNPNYTHGNPQFKAKPYGMNLTMIASYLTGTTTTMNYNLSPRLNISLKYKPRYLLVGV